MSTKLLSVLVFSLMLAQVNGFLQANGCRYTNGLITECDGTQRRATPEEIKLVRQHFTDKKAYFKKQFPPGFPFESAPEDLVYPDFPHLCKTC